MVAVAVALVERFGILQMKDSARLFHGEVEGKFKKCRRFLIVAMVVCAQFVAKLVRNLHKTHQGLTFNSKSYLKNLHHLQYISPQNIQSKFSKNLIYLWYGSPLIILISLKKQNDHIVFLQCSH